MTAESEQELDWLVDEVAELLGHTEEFTNIGSLKIRQTLLDLKSGRVDTLQAENTRLSGRVAELIGYLRQAVGNAAWWAAQHEAPERPSAPEVRERQAMLNLLSELVEDQ